MTNPLNFSESGWWDRILSAMKVLILIVIGLLVVGCGKAKRKNLRTPSCEVGRNDYPTFTGVFSFKPLERAMDCTSTSGQ